MHPIQQHFQMVQFLLSHMSTVKGPDNNWAIDPEGNIFLKGSLQVDGWVDPTYLQLPNQGSPGGFPNNSLLTASSTKSFKDSGGTVKAMASDAALPVCQAAYSDTDRTLGTFNTTIVDVDMTRGSSGNVLIIAGWQGITVDVGPLPDVGCVEARIYAGSSTVALYSDDVQAANHGQRSFGGLLCGVTSVGSGSVNYSLRMNRASMDGNWVVGGGSIGVISID